MIPGPASHCWSLRLFWLGLAGAVAVVMLLPFVWVLSASLKPEAVLKVRDSWVETWVPGRDRVTVRLGEERIEARRLGRTDAGQEEVELLEPHPAAAETDAAGAAGAATGLEPMPAGTRLAVDPTAIEVAWEPDFAWENYGIAWRAVHLGRAYANSLFVGILVTLGQVLLCSLAAFAFARLRFPGRDQLFFAYLATMMIPAAVWMVPLYAMFAQGPLALNEGLGTTLFTDRLYLFQHWEVGRALGIDSYAALILPGLFSAYGTFMLRQFFMGLPRDLEDAARIDGCGLFGIYWHIALPLSRPALAALGIFTFINNWKSFMWPLIVSQSESMRTLPVMLAYFQGEYNTEYNLLMAGTLLAMAPAIVVFLMGQRQFIAGIRMGALKG